MVKARTKHVQRDPAAMKIVLQALFDAGVSLRVQGAALGLHPNRVQCIRAELGLTGPQFEPVNLTDGEWVLWPRFDLYVCRDGRVANARTLRQLKPSKATAQGRVQFTVKVEGQRHTVTVDRALRETFGEHVAPKMVNARRWTDEEVGKLIRARTHADARAALPGRTRDQIAAKLKAMGLRKIKSAPVKAAQLDVGQIMREAMAAVPRYVPSDERDDLVNDLVTMRLEGRREGFDVLLKEARRERNRVMGAWSERSLDAQIGDHDGFTLMDRLDSEGRVW